MKLLDSDNAPAREYPCLMVVITAHGMPEAVIFENATVSVVGQAVCVDGILYDLAEHSVVITRQLTEEDG